MQPGVTAPPFHPNCRCTTKPYDEDVEKFAARVARDAKTGEKFEMPAGTTYADWKKMQDEKYGEGFVDKARKKAYNEKADWEQYRTYKKALGTEAPQSFVNFQKIKYEQPDAHEGLKQSFHVSETHKKNVDDGLFKTYKKRVPEATREDYEVYKAVKDSGIYGIVRVPAEHIDTTVLKFDESHVKKREHDVTIEEAKRYIDNALFSLRREHQSGIIYTNYYSSEGA